jgi:type IV fimbrial biogenesis protein FimT
MNRAPHPQERSRGFTLVEMMVTIAILAILLGIALPDFRQMLASERVRSANSDMFAALIMARSEAIKRNSSVTLVPTSTTTWAGGWTVKAGTTVIQTQDALNAGVSVVQLDGTNSAINPATVTFGGNGRPSPADADTTFIFSSSTVTAVSARCTSLTLTGLPETKRDTDGNAANGCQ